MKGYIFFMAIYVATIGSLSAQVISVNERQLSDALKEKLVSDITEKITSSISNSVQSGEAWVANATNLDIILEPYEVFGINPRDPNFINQANNIHKKIKEKLKNNPGLAYSSLLKTEISDIVKQGMWTYAGSFIDDDSKAIYKETSDLVSAGKKKIQDILEVTEKIKQLDVYDPDYQSEITGVLKRYGVKSDYFYVINDLDQVLSKGYEKLADPIKAIGIIADAAGSDDPMYKIQMMFEFGEAFGGKVPIIGDLIAPLFTLGKAVFEAAKGLEHVLEKNLNQGCIDPGATYGAINPGKRKNFIDKFSYVERACPLNQDVFSPIYNNIYYNTANEQELFFYIKDKWFRGKKDNFHKGASDIRATIQWLRRFNDAEKVNDLGFVFASYQKEYGWSVYNQALDSKITRMMELFHSSYTTVGICDDEKIRDLFMNKIGFEWIVRLFQPTDQKFSWEELKNMNTYWNEEIKKKMIFNYYLSQHKHNLNHLDDIITRLKTYVPVKIYGTVADDAGIPVKDVTLNVSGNSLFENGDKCQQLTTGIEGRFFYYLLVPFDQFTNITVSAESGLSGRSVESQDLRIEPSKSKYYRVNLVSTDSESADSDDGGNGSPGSGAAYGGANNTTGNSGDGWTDTTATDNPGSTDIATLLANSDCANDPNAIAEWDAVNQKVVCTCTENYVWDPGSKRCVQDVQSLLANSDCSEYPNTEPKWDNVANEVYCDCKDGYVWDENNYQNGCISEQQQLLAQTDCSQYLHAEAVWDPVTQTATCDCLPGYVWDKDGIKCVSENQIALQNMDCSHLPNTEPVWDPVNQEAFCDCLPGYEWRDDFKGCEKIVQSQQPDDYY